eukprot:scaffold327848_cov57-Tisochrysis_lutea.AAC.1
MAGVQRLESEQEEHDLHREGTTINKIAVKEVWIFFGWIAEGVKDIEQVVKLAVRITADVNVMTFWHGDINERGQRLEDLLDFQQNLDDIPGCTPS